MRFSESQKRAVALQMRDKFIKGDAEGHEIVIALMALVKKGRISLLDVKPILTIVHMGNLEGVMRSLQKAHSLIDDELIDSILNESE